MKTLFSEEYMQILRMKYIGIWGLILMLPLQNIAQLSTRKEPLKIENLGKAVNSRYDDSSPVITPDGKTIYFIRYNHPKNYFGEEGSCDTWYTEFNEQRKIWTYARRLGNDFNRNRINTIESISPDGNLALIRGAYKKKKFLDEGFSLARKEGKTWSNPEPMDIKGFSKMCKGIYSGAFLANDGRTLFLYFSEKKDDATCDLYVSRAQDDGSWSRPISLGANVNTGSSETTPFLAADSRTLYFASDRPGGEGGYDIYKTEREGKEWDKWSNPVNLGAPINTANFEAYYKVSADGEYAYLSSFFKSQGKLDIIRIKLSDEQKPEPVVLLAGQVFDSETREPIATRIQFNALPNKDASATANSNAVDGSFKMTLPYGNRYLIQVTAPGYEPLEIELNLVAANDFQELTQNLELKKSGPGLAGTDTTDPNANNDGESVDLEALVNDSDHSNSGGVGSTAELDPFAESEARSDAMPVYNKETRISTLFFDTGKVRVKSNSKSELDRIVQLMKDNPKVVLSVQGHTDNVGARAFNQQLSEYRARMVRAYMISQGVPAYRLTYVGFGMQHPDASNNTESGRTQNRRVEFHLVTE